MQKESNYFKKKATGDLIGNKIANKITKKFTDYKTEEKSIEISKKICINVFYLSRSERKNFLFFTRNCESIANLLNFNIISV